MMEILEFALQHSLMTTLLIVASIFPAAYFALKLELISQNCLIEALGSRLDNNSLYNKCRYFVRKTIQDYESRKKEAGFYIRAKKKMKKSGYSSEYAAVFYLFCKFLLPSLFFIIGLALNYPDITRPALMAVLMVVIVELVVAGEKRKINLKFQKYIYKIYKYLHNQISSGVRISDAVKTVYEVIDDKQLRNVLIRLAACYELTTAERIPQYTQALIQSLSVSFRLQ